MKQPAVYIVTNKPYGTLYTGVTSKLAQRAWQHKHTPTGFSATHACNLLVWYELHPTMDSAITKEKQIKSGSRATKLKLIKQSNPNWQDLYQSIL
jgi:putative endonuclease